MAAPARAASIEAFAISSGVTGTLGCLPTVSPAPVTAQVMNTSWFMIEPASHGIAGKAREGAHDETPGEVAHDLARPRRDEVRHEATPRTAS